MSFDIIYPSRINSVVASEENAAFPDDNVLTRYVAEKWKALTETAKLYFVVAANSDSVAVYGTNATSITITVSDGIGVAWGSTADWGSTAAWATYSTLTDTYDLTAGGIGSGWGTYTSKTDVHIVEIKFTVASPTIIECGKVQIGPGNAFNDIQSQPVEGLHDYSIVEQLASGGFYVYSHACVRPFQFTVIETKANCYIMMLDIFKKNGLNIPLAMKLTDVGWEDVVYARHNSPPQMTRVTNDNFMISLDLIQET